LLARVHLFGKDFFANSSDETVLVVGHGRPIAILLEEFIEKKPDWRLWLTRNTSVTILNVADSNTLERFDDVTHLPQELVSGAPRFSRSAN
jgi:broad specificity phosphatase PhoE